MLSWQERWRRSLNQERLAGRAAAGRSATAARRCWRSGAAVEQQLGAARRMGVREGSTALACCMPATAAAAAATTAAPWRRDHRNTHLAAAAGWGRQRRRQSLQHTQRTQQAQQGQRPLPWTSARSCSRGTPAAAATMPCPPGWLSSWTWLSLWAGTAPCCGRAPCSQAGQCHPSCPLPWGECLPPSSPLLLCFALLVLAVGWLHADRSALACLTLGSSCCILWNTG